MKRKCRECGISPDLPRTLKTSMLPCGKCGKTYQPQCRTCGKATGLLICRAYCHYNERDHGTGEYLGDHHCPEHLRVCRTCKVQVCTTHMDGHYNFDTGETCKADRGYMTLLEAYGRERLEASGYPLEQIYPPPEEVA